MPSFLSLQYSPHYWRLNYILFHQFILQSYCAQKKIHLRFTRELIKHNTFSTVTFCSGEKQTYKEVALIKSCSDRYYFQYKECYVLILQGEIILYFPIIYITVVGSIIHTQLPESAKFPATATFYRIVSHTKKPLNKL